MAKRLRNWQNGAGYSTGKYSVKIENKECKGNIRSVSDAKIDICIYLKKTCLGASTAFLQVHDFPREPAICVQRVAVERMPSASGHPIGRFASHVSNQSSSDLFSNWINRSN